MRGVARSMSQNTSHACALITGASAGLGEEYARQLAPRVRHLVLVARREDRLQALANALRAEFPDTAMTIIAADLAELSERLRLAEALHESGLTPDLLVNNAGLGDYGEFVTAEWPRLEAMLRVNVEALTHLTHLLVSGMCHNGGGAVIHISSLASLMPIPDFAVYAATKAYVTSFSEALRIELREHGIRVLAVCPGPVRTEFGKIARRNENQPGIPGREWFYVPREQVVAESLIALDNDCARVFPALKTAAAALVISVVPMVLMRLIMARRPRKG